MCIRDRAPTTCSHMIVDHSDYLKILRRVRELPGVKKVFIRSGIRFDYLMACLLYTSRCV